MKATIKTDVLQKALSKLSLAAESRNNSIPILSSVRIDAAWNLLVFSATNLEIYITNKVGATISKEGSICVGYRTLKNFIARATSVDTRFELQDKVLVVSHGENEGRFETLPSDEFPPDIEMKTDPMTCEAKDLVRPLQLVKHCMSTNEARTNLMGVNVHKNEAATELCACDGHRLALFTSQLKYDGSDIILPSIAVEAIATLIEEGQLEIRNDGSQIEIRNGNLAIQSRLIEGSFPNYRQVIPEKRDTAFSAQRKELIHAIETASIFLGQREIAVRLKGDKKELEVGCQNKFKTKLVGTELSGQPDVQKNVNYSMLLDALESIEGDDARIEVSQDSPSLVFREGSYLEVVQCVANPNG